MVKISSIENNDDNEMVFFRVNCTGKYHCTNVKVYVNIASTNVIKCLVLSDRQSHAEMCPNCYHMRTMCV